MCIPNTWKAPVCWIKGSLFYMVIAQNSRWLRTKNVMEKINDALFAWWYFPWWICLELSTTKLNKLVRPYYADSIMNFNNEQLDILYSDFGPFWYRLLYSNIHGHINTIDSTMRQYPVKKIANRSHYRCRYHQCAAQWNRSSATDASCQWSFWSIAHAGRKIFPRSPMVKNCRYYYN